MKSLTWLAERHIHSQPHGHQRQHAACSACQAVHGRTRAAFSFFSNWRLMTALCACVALAVEVSMMAFKYCSWCRLYRACTVGHGAGAGPTSHLGDAPLALGAKHKSGLRRQ